MEKREGGIEKGEVDGCKKGQNEKGDKWWGNEKNELDRREFLLERKGDRPKKTRADSK